MAVAVSAWLSAIALAPIGYPHSKLVINTLSQEIPNNVFVIERFDRGATFNVRVVSTVKGKSAGNTLYAHTVSPSKKLCIYFVGADINTAATPTNSSVNNTLRYFTDYYIQTRQ